MKLKRDIMGFEPIHDATRRHVTPAFRWNHWPVTRSACGSMETQKRRFKLWMHWQATAPTVLCNGNIEKRNGNASKGAGAR